MQYAPALRHEGTHGSAGTATTKALAHDQSRNLAALLARREVKVAEERTMRFQRKGLLPRRLDQTNRTDQQIVVRVRGNVGGALVEFVYFDLFRVVAGIQIAALLAIDLIAQCRDFPEHRRFSDGRMCRIYRVAGQAA